MAIVARPLKKQTFFCDFPKKIDCFSYFKCLPDCGGEKVRKVKHQDLISINRIEFII